MAQTRGKRPRKAGTSAGGRKSDRSGSRSGRKAGTGAGKKAARNSLFLPLLTVWFIALVVLASLLYWGRGPYRGLWKSGRPAGVPAERTVERGAPAAVPTPRTEPRPPAGPEHTSNSTQARGDSAESRPHAAAVGGGSPAPFPREEAPPAGPPLAQVAIVIDDFGQDLSMAKRFLNIPISITFSILPGLKHSREIAELATVHGHEVMIHMPMEPEGYPEKNPGPGALLVSMSRRQIEESLDDAFRENPYAKGINNHMGSRFTASKEQMERVLSRLKKQGLYFLDSYTSPNSVGVQLAKRMGVATIKRDIFLDHVPTETFVRKQIRELIRRARIQGRAVAIGHPYPVTLKVLQEEALSFEKEGIEVVPLGRLVNGG